MRACFGGDRGGRSWRSQSSWINVENTRPLFRLSFSREIYIAVLIRTLCSNNTSGQAVWNSDIRHVQVRAKTCPCGYPNDWQLVFVCVVVPYGTAGKSYPSSFISNNRICHNRPSLRYFNNMRMLQIRKLVLELGWSSVHSRYWC
jgi:hypothetical protein